MAKLRNSIPSAAMEKPVELLTVPGVTAYDGWLNVSIGVWVSQATFPAVRRVHAMSSELSRLHPSGRSSVVFVLDQVNAPTPEAQAELNKFYGNDSFAGFAIVLEGTGFWASGIRGMANNAQRVAAASVTQRVCTSIEEVVSWLPSLHLTRTGVALPSDAFRRALLAVRERCVRRAREATAEL